MPENPGLEVLKTTLGWLGSAGFAALVGVFLNARRPGARQEQTGPSSAQLENDRLSARDRELQEENDRLRARDVARDLLILNMLRGREATRYKLNTLERKHGEPVTDWPPDPPDQPVGGD